MADAVFDVQQAQLCIRYSRWQQPTYVEPDQSVNALLCCSGCAALCCAAGLRSSVGVMTSTLLTTGPSSQLSRLQAANSCCQG
jgi:hypothetical protein